MRKKLHSYYAKFLQKRELIIILILIILNCITVFRTIPPSRLMNNEPFRHQDYVLHFYNALNVSSILYKDKALWGYNPSFAAGYPIGFIESLDNRAAELFVYLAYNLGIGKAQAFKLFVTICFLSFPLIIYLAAINLSLFSKERIIATAFAIIFWYSQKPNFLKFGMFSFLTISFLYIYIVSLFYKYIKFKRVKDFLLMTIFGSLIFLIHIFAFFCLIIPVLFLYIYNFAELNIKTHLTIILCILIIFLINIFSIYPILINKELVSTDFTNSFLGGIKRLLFDFLYDGKKLFHNILLVFGIIGLFLWMKNKDKSLYLTFTAASIFFFTIIYFGKYNNSYAKLGPFRFYHALIFLMLYPASSALAYLINHLKDRYSAKKAYFIMSIFIFLLFPFILAPFKTIYKPAEFFSSPLPKESNIIINWVNNNTTQDGRILLEIGAGDKNLHFNSQFATLLSIYCQREFIGGPQYLITNKYFYVNFYDGIFFSKPITDYSKNDLKEYVKKYNIIWIISWSKDAVKTFDSLHGFVNKINQIGRFSIYKVIQNPTFFLKGNGKIKAEINRINIQNATEGEVIIKYHWLPTFKTDPPLPIEPYNIKDDPIGFIKVKNGNISNFLIYNSYK